MSKRKKEEAAAAGCPAWLATYGDLVTLVLTFFVLLYSFSIVDADKLMEFAQSFSGGEPNIIDFNEPSGITGLMGSGILDFSIPTDATEPPKEDNAEGLTDILSEYTQMLENALASNMPSYFADEYGEQSPVTITMEDGFTKFAIESDIFFDSGEAVLKTEALPAMDIIAELILTMFSFPGSNVVIEGHTDSNPISTVRFPDNWALSSARAEAVLRILMERTGLEGSYFKSVGRGEYQPIADNATAEGRKQNRRVIIYIEQDAAGKR